jgi:hypothetical protein
MTNNTERNAFEEWADEFRTNYRPFNPDEYDIAKLAWQAALAQRALCTAEGFVSKDTPKTFVPCTPEEAAELAWEVEQENPAQITCFKYGDVHCTNEGLAAIINAWVKR